MCASHLLIQVEEIPYNLAKNKKEKKRKLGIKARVAGWHWLQIQFFSKSKPNKAKSTVDRFENVVQLFSMETDEF